jgi:PHD/YefM family antitoxin component YafN of YafNO toxin-antitoxin module
MSPTMESEQLGSFTDNPEPILRRLRETGSPMLLTGSAEGDIVVIGAEQYRRMIETTEHLETIAAVKQGLSDAKAGRTRPMREALADLRQKHGIPVSNGD